MVNEFISHSESDTISFSEDFAKTLDNNSIIILSGDLGSRKNKIYTRNTKTLWPRRRNF